MLVRTDRVASRQRLRWHGGTQEAHVNIELVPLCLEHGMELDGPDGASDFDKAAFLLGMTGQESGWGDRWQAGRYETAYARGGHYHKTSPDQIRLVQKHEDLAAISWGPWQILPVVAYEVGFRGAPWELADPRTSAAWVVKRFNLKCFQRTAKEGTAFVSKPRGGVTWASMFAFWNGGPSLLGDSPHEWPEMVRGYVTAQMTNMDEAKGILETNLRAKRRTQAT